MIPAIRTMIARIQIPATSSSLWREKPKIRAFFGSGEIKSVITPEKDNSRNANKDSRNRNFGSLLGAILEFISSLR
jgi:hypothetical protein